MKKKEKEIVNRIVYDEENKRAIIQQDNSIFLVQKNIEELVGKFEKDKIIMMKKDNFGTIFFTIVQVIVIIISMSIFFYLANKNITIESSFFISTVILIFNIFIHEITHILILKYYHEKPSKIGFTFVFIFPAFYVRTTNSYFLSRYRRINVYLGGIFANALYVIFSLGCFFISNQTIFISSINMVIITMIFNLIPIIRTDGFYVLQTFFSRYTLKVNKHWYDSIIRGGIVILIFFLIEVLFKK
ncbi:MAG: hypothetical protein ACRCU3_10665 [Eubacteriaceae bacterium]